MAASHQAGPTTTEPADDPVRRVRQLMATPRAGIAPGDSAAIARELRRLGRPDLSLEWLETDAAIADSAAGRAERAATLAALGHADQAAAAVESARRVDPRNGELVALEITLARRASGDTLRGFDVARLVASLADADGLQVALRELPLSALSVADMFRLARRIAVLDPLRLPATLARYVVGRAVTLLSRAIATLLFLVAGLLSGGRPVYVTAFNRFTRLADLVDRLDPLLRRLSAQHGAGNFRLFTFFFAGYPNRQLSDMYARLCTILPATTRFRRRLATVVIAVLRRAGRFTDISVDYRRIKDDALRHPPVIAFRDEEAATLRRQMERCGIDPGKKLICFGLRDMAYYQFYGDVWKIPLAQQGRRAETHHRCPPLDSYISFARYWAERDYQVVRMGLRVSEALPKDIHPNVIDYASGERSDEVDAFLFQQCRFLVAGDTGLFSGAAAFDRATVVSDLFLIRNTIYSTNKQARSIFVPKLIVDEREQRYLSFRELIFFNHFFSFNEDCASAGFRIVHNAPDDIIDASLELAENLEGRDSRSAEDRELQRRFHSIYPPSHIGYGSTGLVSTKFLRKYAHLLD